MANYDFSELDGYVFGSPFWAGVNDRLWVDDCKPAQDAFFEDLLATEEGKQYAEFRGPDTDEQLFAYYRFSRFYGNKEISVSSMTKALTDMMLSNSFERQVVVDDRPRDKNGKVLTEAQLAWREFGEWERTHSAEECRQRARKDAAFGVFLREKVEGEWAATQSSGGAVVPTDRLPATQTGKVPQDVLDFVEKYHKLSVAQCRSLSNAASNPDGYKEWNRLFEAARAAGKI
jgi:hypothetical protein